MVVVGGGWWLVVLLACCLAGVELLRKERKVWLTYRNTTITGIEVSSVLDEVRVRVSSWVKASCIYNSKLDEMACEGILGIKAGTKETVVANMAEEVYAQATWDPNTHTSKQLVCCKLCFVC